MIKAGAARLSLSRSLLRPGGGLLLHCGREAFWLDERVLAVPWWRVM